MTLLNVLYYCRNRPLLMGTSRPLLFLCLHQHRIFKDLRRLYRPREISCLKFWTRTSVNPETRNLEFFNSVFPAATTTPSPLLGCLIDYSTIDFLDEPHAYRHVSAWHPDSLSIQNKCAVNRILLSFPAAILLIFEEFKFLLTNHIQAPYRLFKQELSLQSR